MASDQPPVTVVVLSYNRPAYLRECLEALAAQTYAAERVVVVDNRSAASDRVADVVAGFPGVDLIRNPTNLGFTGGMNAGIAAATGKYVLLTEDDIVADRGCLAELVRCMEADPDIGLCGGVLINRGDGAVRCAGGELSLGTRYGKRIFTAGDAPAPYFVSYLPGALLTARLEDLRRWRGFRPDFFMYHEDDELCLRVREAGRRVAVAPAAKVHHFDPEPGRCPYWLEFVKVRNFFRLYLLHAPASVLPAVLGRYVAWEFLREAVRLRPRCLLVLGAFLDTAFRSPWLLRDRYRRPAGDPATTAPSSELAPQSHSSHVGMHIQSR